MKKRLARCVLAICINSLFLTFNLTAQTSSDDSSVRFRLLHDYLIIVPVQVNKVSACDFLLDTGTNSTVITPELATHIKLRPVDRIELVTIAGSQITTRSYLRELSIGSESIENVEVLTADLQELRRLDRRICGVLGQNALGKFNYLINYRDRRVKFVEAEQGETRVRGARLRVERNEGRLVLAVPSANKTTAYLVLDSAISHVALFESGYRKLRQDIERKAESSARISTNAGNGVAQLAVLRNLRLGENTLHDLPAALLQIGAANLDRSDDGLLPTCLFRSIFFNNKEGYVVFNPQIPELSMEVTAAQR